MSIFLIPDLHGRPIALRALLFEAGIIDDEGQRVNRDDLVVSIGDLLNGTYKDYEGDLESLRLSEDWIDVLIVGNHEIEYIFPDMGMSFNGYHPAQDIISQYRSLFFQGKVVPALLVGETLITHAGVMEYFNFNTSLEAYDAIHYSWQNLARLAFDEEGESFEFDFSGQGVTLPKETLITAVAKDRGGSYPYAGILWSDWKEPKNTNFSQIVGHTPMKNGPVLHEQMGTDTFTLNIDCSAKSGEDPVGVWVDDDGLVLSYVYTHFLTKPPKGTP
jgi:hypothetical protein